MRPVQRQAGTGTNQNGETHDDQVLAGCPEPLRLLPLPPGLRWRGVRGCEGPRHRPGPLRAAGGCRGQAHRPRPGGGLPRAVLGREVGGRTGGVLGSGIGRCAAGAGPSLGAGRVNAQRGLQQGCHDLCGLFPTLPLGLGHAIPCQCGLLAALLLELNLLVVPEDRALAGTEKNSPGDKASDMLHLHGWRWRAISATRGFGQQSETQMPKAKRL
mmetsp:Transcript_104219/g.321514  ORF Transcript_104219/g.321514 Transcript_104219/m.321514 type:complete len:214 (-) Transcript_104219:3-644(-)